MGRRAGRGRVGPTTTAPEAPATLAGYATRVHTLALGSVTVPLAAVAHLEAHVDTAALLRDADAPEPPYWAHLWPGSRALARLVATEISCTGRRIVEVGCGLGLAGIAAARRRAQVVLFDHVYAAVQFAHLNVRLNGVDALAVQGDVFAPPFRGRFDHCLAADVTYDPALQDAVAAFLAASLAPHGRGWCAESVRTFDAGFARACAARGLRVEERELHEPDDGRDTLVRLHVVTR